MTSISRLHTPADITLIERDDPITTPNRVPAITVDFWLIKLMAVTMGETAADFLAGLAIDDAPGFSNAHRHLPLSVCTTGNGIHRVEFQHGFGPDN